ncbi:Signal transduction histidine kinase [Enhygromyxa salina]|uniref:histidine kinase n=1 Tax=Enhygromyxa salina TaxID=215803 RepID=A0A0C2CNP5_9BACT|nr:HAMP domain-containing sensor histidine kinase [Enhygromyxa salina]KIG12846.1 Signal transduction histidine kinase [Enhygromyxa salina]
MREELGQVFDASTGVDEFVHGLMAFLVELSRSHPNHPMLTALSDELGRASSVPLAASAVHDLRSVLQGVSAGLDYAPVLLERSGVLKHMGVDTRRLELLLEAIDDARTGTQLAAELAAETLAVQRDCMVSEPHDPSQSESIRINDVLRAAGRLGGRLAPLELRLETSEDTELNVSRSAIMRVMVNLLRNAAHAIHELEDPVGAAVTISSWASDEFVFVQVADDGPGIPAAATASIFDLFFTTHAEGTGIGLYVCKTLVSAWGGMIHVDSRDGEGARFTFSVPKVNAGS